MPTETPMASRVLLRLAHIKADHALAAAIADQTTHAGHEKLGPRVKRWNTRAMQPRGGLSFWR
jgi:hypothetical protein